MVDWISRDVERDPRRIRQWRGKRIADDARRRLLDRRLGAGYDPVSGDGGESRDRGVRRSTRSARIGTSRFRSCDRVVDLRYDLHRRRRFLLAPRPGDAVDAVLPTSLTV